MRDPADWWKDEPEPDPLVRAILEDKAATLTIEQQLANRVITPPEDESERG